MDYVNSLYNQPLRLTYSLHSKTMMESVQSCQRRLCYTDVQLISEGGIVFAHSIVLAAASNFLKQLLITNTDPTIVIHLPGVEYEPLRLLLVVLYGGEELQLTLKQVVALQNLGSLLQIDMCNSTAMEQAFLQASQEGVLSIPGSLQQSVDTVSYSNESSPVPTPQPPTSEASRRSHAKSSSSPSKASQNHNNNNNTPNNNNGSNSGSGGKKRKAASSQQNSRRSSPAPVAPFSLLSNVSATKYTGRRILEEDLDGSLMIESVDDETSAPPQVPIVYKKPSRAALKEMVTCRECHTPFKLIMQLNQHMTREGHLFPPCPECGVSFTTLESLIGHADVHASETVFTCKYCQKGVLGFDRYLYHMLMCKSLIRGDYVCFICRKSFRNSGSLKTHLLLHTGAKPFPCNYCSASFRQRHHRSHHERSVHLQMQGCPDGVDQAPPSEGALPETGSVATPQASSVVDGSRPFPCGFCNAAFRQSNHRSYHERVIHGVDRRTRQPKSGARAAEASGGPAAGSANGASKSAAMGNGFGGIIEAEEEEMDADDAEDLAEELEADADAEGDADADGWEEEIASPGPDEEDEVADEDEEVSDGD